MTLALLLLLGSTEYACNFSKVYSFVFFHSRVPNISVTLFIVFENFFPPKPSYLEHNFLVLVLHGLTQRVLNKWRKN